MTASIRQLTKRDKYISLNLKMMVAHEGHGLILKAIGEKNGETRNCENRQYSKWFDD
jgi:hypothetical protein